MTLKTKEGIPLTHELLQLIATIQAYRDFCNHAHKFFNTMQGKPHDGPADLRAYFYSFPRELLQQYKLERTNECLNAILAFKITKFMFNMSPFGLAGYRLIIPEKQY